MYKEIKDFYIEKQNKTKTVLYFNLDCNLWFSLKVVVMNHRRI